MTPDFRRYIGMTQEQIIFGIAWGLGCCVAYLVGYVFGLDDGGAQ